MSSDYYFRKWKKTLTGLESLIHLDLYYQETKIHDKQCCEAAQRLTGILGRYITCYNDALDCLQQNLQVQKTLYINDIIQALVARIQELKQQLRKLEGAYYQFKSDGLIDHKLTADEAEFCDIPTKYERREEMNKAIQQAFQKAKEIRTEKIRQLNEQQNITTTNSEINKWWVDTVEVIKEPPKRLNMAVYEIEEKVSKETMERNKKVSLIQAHERTRQVTIIRIKEKQRRLMWEKELNGTLKPTANIELREKCAKLIQFVFRSYFDLKRKKIKDCKRDEMLQIKLCTAPNYKEIAKDKQKKAMQFKLYKKYEEQRMTYKEELVKSYNERYRDAIAEDIGDNIRNWFQKWYKEVNFFYNIPKEIQGGSTLILKEEVPSPAEWRQNYEAYLEKKRANKNKSGLQIKWEKEAAKEEKMLLRREEMKKQKLEAHLLKKMMKNPTLHPGYLYPVSTKTEKLIQTINRYYNDWRNLDNDGKDNVKEKFIKKIDEEQLHMEGMFEICKSADIEMREELKALRKALKKDYERNNEQMPEQMKEKFPRKKKKPKNKTKVHYNVEDKLMDLAIKHVLKEYPRKDLAAFLGDSNFAGHSLRYKLKPALHYGAETRDVWWEYCREITHGSKRILLVGPKGSGKTTLVHILASLNEATLYEFNPTQLEDVNRTEVYLRQLINDVAICSKATQPSIIYIKDIQNLYNKKKKSHTEDKNTDFDLMKRFFVNQLFKRISKHDNVTIIGTCIDPWLSKSKQMLKKFSAVLLLSNTSYSAVYLILRKWVLDNRSVPQDFDINSLSYVLQGYSFGYIVKALNEFLTPDRIVKIAAYGLKPQAIYKYILDNHNETKADYGRYIQWYSENTKWGKRESKRLQDDKEFKQLLEEWEEKMKKKKGMQNERDNL